MNRIKLRNQRPKALFGIGEIAAAGITAAATLAAAGIGARASAKSAKEQAQATLSSTKQQIEQMQKQNENETRLAERNIEVQKELNQENNRLYQRMQMQNAMQMGEENMNEVRRENKLVAKNGISVKNKNNMPFKVTDGGSYRLKYITGEGYPVIEFIGDTHNQKHKVGKSYKTGIGLKFENGGELEVEGGEEAIVTPNSVMVNSKHDIAGFNPVEATDNGMNPIEAHYTQEMLKDIYNIPDDGNKLARKGTCIKLRKAKGKSRCKAINGTLATNLMGAGITGVGNVLGALIGASGARKAGKIASNAAMSAANMLSDAYKNLRTINPNILSRESFNAPSAIANVRSARYNINPQLTDVDRSVIQQSKAVNNTTSSSAARLARLAAINSTATDAKSRIYGAQSNAEEQIKQNNAKIINDIAMFNAENQAKSNQAYTNALLDLAKYNNDIVNQRTTGSAEALSSGIMQSANAKANAMTNARSMWANSIAQIGKGFGDSLSAYAAYKQNLNLAGMKKEGQYTLPNDDINFFKVRREQRRLRNQFRNQAPGVVSTIQPSSIIIPNLAPIAINPF